MSFKQVITIAAILLTAGGGYAFLVWNQSAASRDIADIKLNAAAVALAVTTTSKEQDTKREQMGKDFIASTDKIATKVSDLGVQMAVTQQQAKLQTDTLDKISSQLGELSLAAGHPSRH